LPGWSEEQPFVIWKDLVKQRWCFVMLASLDEWRLYHSPGSRGCLSDLSAVTSSDYSAFMVTMILTSSPTGI
jgi:hypothetical protein